MSNDDLSLDLPDSLEISPEDLVTRIEAGEEFQVMDVRAPARLEQGRLDLVPEDRYQNIRGSELMHIHDLSATGLAPELPTVVVCGHGKDSKVLAFHLGRLGMDAHSLAGGLARWMRLTVPRVLDPPEGVDHLIQFDRIGKGSPIMAAKYGVPYHLHPADAVYPYDGTPGTIRFQPLADGDQIDFGETSLQVMHTPGHTEGSVSFLLEQRVALTGDFLFVESIGRPDLGGKEEPWARQLWASVVRAIREWPDGMAIYPAHYASEDERRMGQAVGAPFGTLLRTNEILQIQDPEVFLWRILSGKAPFPDAYRKIKALNVGLAPIVESEVEVLEMGRNECALGGP